MGLQFPKLILLLSYLVWLTIVYKCYKEKIKHLFVESFRCIKKKKKIICNQESFIFKCIFVGCFLLIDIIVTFRFFKACSNVDYTTFRLSDAWDKYTPFRFSGAWCKFDYFAPHEDKRTQHLFVDRIQGACIWLLWFWNINQRRGISEASHFWLPLCLSILTNTRTHTSHT